MIYLKLFLVFARIGLFGFGGGMAMLPIIYQGAESFGLMSRQEFSDLVAISQVTPGPIAVNAATYVGYQCAGLPGALAATIGVALPSFILVILVCRLMRRFSESSWVKGAFLGVRPVTVGLIASAVIFMGQSAFTQTQLVPGVICGASILLVASKKVNPVVIVIAAGVIGAIVFG